MSAANHSSSFPPTQWTDLIQPIKDQAPHAPEALNRLCEIYRPPILQFFRRRGIDAHQAEDLTQAFIASLLRNDVWSRIDRGNGLFRCYLASRVRWFLLNYWKSLKTPTSQFDELDDNQLDEGGTPEDEFDRNWAWALVRLALAQVERDWNEKEAEIRFQDLAGFLTTEADQVSIEILSQRYGKTPNTLYQGIFRLRKAYKATLTSLVRQTVSSEAEVKSEIAFLMECLK